jgi:hypothetical protein
MNSEHERNRERNAGGKAWNVMALIGGDGNPFVRLS